MLVAMGLAAAACILIGVFPGAAVRAPSVSRGLRSVHRARTSRPRSGLLGFTALGFFLMLKHLDPEPIISLDTDWFYRRPLSAVQALAERRRSGVEDFVGRISDVVMQRNATGRAALLRQLDAG